MRFAYGEYKNRAMGQDESPQTFQRFGHVALVVQIRSCSRENAFFSFQLSSNECTQTLLLILILEFQRFCRKCLIDVARDVASVTVDNLKGDLRVCLCLRPLNLLCPAVHGYTCCLQCGNCGACRINPVTGTSARPWVRLGVTREVLKTRG